MSANDNCANEPMSHQPITMVCTGCLAEFRGKTEYEAEVKFNRHECPALKNFELRRVDELKPGDRYRELDDAAQPYGPTYTVRTIPCTGPGAKHLGHVSKKNPPAKVTFKTAERGWIEVSVLNVVQLVK